MRKTTSLTVSLPDELVEKMDAYCKATGAKRSGLVRAAVSNMLQLWENVK